MKAQKTERTETTERCDEDAAAGEKGTVHRAAPHLSVFSVISVLRRRHA